MERQNSLQEKGRLAVERIDEYSREMAEGSQEAAFSLLRTFSFADPDRLPEIRIKPIEFAQPQILDRLSPKEVLAVTLAQDFCSKFNRNFGVGTNAGELISWKIGPMRWFFQHLGATLQAVLHPEGQYAQGRVGLAGHLAFTTHRYYELINWAENELTQPVEP